MEGMIKNPVTTMLNAENKASDLFLSKKLINMIKKTTKNTSRKNLYCAEKMITRMLLINNEIHIRLMILFFLKKLKMIKTIRLMIKEMLTADLIPSKKSQFLI
jgi:hypothetical protein